MESSTTRAPTKPRPSPWLSGARQCTRQRATGSRKACSPWVERSGLGPLGSAMANGNLRARYLPNAETLTRSQFSIRTKARQSCAGPTQRNLNRRPRPHRQRRPPRQLRPHHRTPGLPLLQIRDRRSPRPARSPTLPRMFPAQARQRPMTPTPIAPSCIAARRKR